MIIGIGTDIVNINRIAESLERTGERLARRILTDAEFTIFQEKHNSAAFLAKRFAAKEAAVKALGTGIGRVSWQDLHVSNNDQGAPLLTASGNAAEIMLERGATHLHLSLSDEEDVALAFVILEAG